MMLTLDSVSFCTNNFNACRSGLAVPVVSFLILVLKCPGTLSSRDNSNYFQGSYAESKDSICQPCGPGTVQPDAAKTSCNLCPVGQVPDSERTKCVHCGEVSWLQMSIFIYGCLKYTQYYRRCFNTWQSGHITVLLCSCPYMAMLHCSGHLAS